MRGELARMIDAHRRTLDQLATGVAIFTADQRLTFYNAAYRALWELDTGFLDQSPTDSAVLDQLRAARKLPEQADFREWKTALHEAYRALEPREHLWHLPDGRTMRVVTTPNPEGGVTYLFDDVTERLDLERRYDALIRVQGETLDNLAEAVAVFGSDGRLRLHNPAFVDMWRLEPLALGRRGPHIEAVIGWCRTLYDDDALWRRCAARSRRSSAARSSRAGWSCATAASSTDHGAAARRRHAGHVPRRHRHRQRRARAERAQRGAGNRRRAQDRFRPSRVLRAALAAHQHHRLRVICWATRRTGPLSAKQREYLGYITTSTNALLAIINDILDLATIDAGAMTLNLGFGRHPRHHGRRGRGHPRPPDQGRDRARHPRRADIGSFPADERRVRQVLFNLLSNAVGFSPPGDTITLSAERRPDAVVFSVTDNGPGIPPEVKDRVFDWFEIAFAGLAPSRRRPRPLDRALLRRAARRHGDARLGGRPGHHGRLQLPARAARRAAAAAA